VDIVDRKLTICRIKTSGQVRSGYVTIDQQASGGVMDKLTCWRTMPSGVLANGDQPGERSWKTHSLCNQAIGHTLATGDKPETCGGDIMGKPTRCTTRPSGKR
jgi:hypothetical protein